MHRERVVTELDKLRALHGNNAAAAAAVGVSVDAFEQWRSRKSVPGQHLAAFARAARVSGDFLLGLADDPRGKVRYVREPPEAWADFRDRPCIGVVGAGPGHDVDLQAEGEDADRYVFRQSWFKDTVGVPFEAVRLVKVHHHERFGRSMEPTVCPGALLAVDIRPTESVVNGSLYLAWQPDEGMVVKRVFKVDDRTVVLWSDNPGYAPRVQSAAIGEGDEISRVLRGRVLWHGEELVPVAHVHAAKSARAGGRHPRAVNTPGEAARVAAEIVSAKGGKAR